MTRIQASCLAFMLCVKLHGAVQDDIARAFLAGVVANNAVPVLTNATVITPLGVAIVTATNVANFSVAGGLIYFDLNSYTNLSGSGALTNLSQVILPAHTLTNFADSIYMEWPVVLPNAPNTNRFTIELGSIVLLDTGLQICSNTTVNASARITRTGNSSQRCEATISWGPGGGVPFHFTNRITDQTLDNGVSRRLSLNGAARRGGAHTNLGMRIVWSGLR